MGFGRAGPVGIEIREESIYNGWEVYRLNIYVSKGGMTSMGKVFVFLGSGFEEIEALTVVDVARRAGIDVEMVSITGERMVTGSHHISVAVDLLFEEVDFEEAEMLVLPGGLPGVTNLEAFEPLMQKLDEFHQAGKLISAICAAPSILGHRGILKGIRACCYPGYEKDLTDAKVTDGPVEMDGHIITSRGMGTSMEFALAITEKLMGREKADVIGDKTIFKR